MASPGHGRRQPLWSFGRQPDGDAARGWVAAAPAGLFSQPPGPLEATEGLLRVVLLLAPEEPGRGWTARTEEPRGRSGHQLALDVAGFSAEELSVSLEGRKLTVVGKQEKEAAAARDGCVCRETRQVRQELLLPADADLDALTCALHPDGHLRLRAPRLERCIPVQVERRRSPSEAGETDGGAEAHPAGGEEPDGADEQGTGGSQPSGSV